MGKMVVETALISILNFNFNFINDEELTIANHSLTIAIDGPIEVKLSNRQKNLNKIKNTIGDMFHLFPLLFYLFQS